MYGDEVKHRTVQVYWSGDDAWFVGTIQQYDGISRHFVVYQDGDVKWHDLHHEETHDQLRWVAAENETPPRKRARTLRAHAQEASPSSPCSAAEACTAAPPEAFSAAQPEACAVAVAEACAAPAAEHCTAAVPAATYARVVLRLRQPWPAADAFAIDASSAYSTKDAPAAIGSGLVVGGDCLAVGLHAGHRDWFKARFVRMRAMVPQYLVRYVADVDGNTGALRLPEVRNSWVQAHEIAPWHEPACKRPPTAAKTRGQLSDRDSGAGGGRASRGATVRTPRRVRFSDEVTIIGFSATARD